MSGKSRLLSLLGGLLLSERDVRDVRSLSASFRLIELAPPSSGKGTHRPGDKVQVLLDGQDEVRTYTPIAWGSDGSMALLAFVHGDTPASRWAKAIEKGQRLRFLAPQRSLSMDEGAITLIGDETSLAVAASYARSRPGRVRALFEIEESTALDDVAKEIGVSDATIVTRSKSAPRGSALLDAIRDVKGPVGLTGGGELIQTVRARLRDQGVKDIKSKAYWIEGRRGID